MIKKIIFGLAIAMLGILPAKADETKPTIAILDTAIDTSLPIFQGRIVQEVCILDWPSCPNGDYYMEGTGSAVLPYEIISRNGFSHGTQMASIAALANKDVNIIFIRIIAHNSMGYRMPTSESTLAEAMTWVKDNKDKYNIQAVSMSQGHHKLLYYRQYCPSSKLLQPIIYELKTMSIPVFLPTGNNGDQNRIDWPACIADSIAIGSVDLNNSIATNSNVDVNLTDFYAKGTVKTYSVGNSSGISSGTSVATQVAAAQWMYIKGLKPNLTYDEMYSLISRTSYLVKNKNISSGKLINVKGAING
jgi:hypothetical protein